MVNLQCNASTTPDDLQCQCEFAVQKNCQVCTIVVLVTFETRRALMLTSMLINYEKLKFLRYASNKIPVVKFTENSVNLALLKTLLLYSFLLLHRKGILQCSSKVRIVFAQQLNVTEFLNT